ncbi:hypothetical protein M434DRAFT_18049 [Hypoxylon sp. CO27-5]|nr:hypothetical protein M434DRAFT_18049 [Hypoxylon sp. CO27-5]
MLLKFGETNLSACGGILASMCLYPLVGAYYCIKYTGDAIDAALYTASDIQTRCRVSFRRLPKSKPLAVKPTSLESKEPLTSPATGMPTSYNTISLFGAQIARYFCRNVSPEGLQRVRFVHVAHVIPSDTWDSSSERKNVAGAMRILRDSLPGLRQLDVEVALTYGQPKDPERFWVWLREDVLGQFRGLERFVLKVPVYLPFTPIRSQGWEGWTPLCEPLSSWDDGEYQALKAKATSSDEAVLS